MALTLGQTSRAQSLLADLDGKSVGSDLSVGPGKWAIGRLRNFPAGYECTIRIQNTQSILFLMLDEEQLKLFPKVSEPLLLARVANGLEAKMRIAQEGDYYLLFWNKENAETVKLRFTATVQAP
ncbi:hypothetical protein [Thiorhodovibrio winogradskyi]|uniref:hypothetical protein n=1 Tax=Thiorhodovibrio winogradskyi TaxID=77007 RepID=UPI002E29D86A|nr:hypothetical protein [Thiorhodovibrio winogradskyi]